MEENNEFELEENIETTMVEIPIIFGTIEEGEIKIRPDICKLTIDFNLIDAYGEVIVKYDGELKYYTQIITSYNSYICTMEYNEFKTLYGSFIDSLRLAKIISVSEKSMLTNNRNLNDENI